ncbi:hypothetical protein SMC26_17075 [Actinomadura fulvescens]|uniref:Uncharacterized protein n=1 Tax=Actinomadura fulvescens TaxID=46160 RepID=A0ABP6CP83_9ACTN
MRKVTGAALAVLTAASTLVAISAPAEAAPRKCTVGKWRLTKAAGQVKGPSSTLRFAGGHGTTLQLTPKGRAIYTFTRSARVTEYGSAKGVPFQLWLKYDKGVLINAKITGNKKGTITLRPKTATGRATLHGRVMKPAQYPLKKQSFTHLFKRGQADEALVPLHVSFTCTAKTLRLHQKKKTRTGYTTVANWSYRRI